MSKYNQQLVEAKISIIIDTMGQLIQIINSNEIKPDDYANMRLYLNMKLIEFCIGGEIVPSLEEPDKWEFKFNLPVPSVKQYAKVKEALRLFTRNYEDVYLYKLATIDSKIINLPLLPKFQANNRPSGDILNGPGCMLRSPINVRGLSRLFHESRGIRFSAAVQRLLS